MAETETQEKTKKAPGLEELHAKADAIAEEAEKGSLVRGLAFVVKLVTARVIWFVRAASKEIDELKKWRKEVDTKLDRLDKKVIEQGGHLDETLSIVTKLVNGEGADAGGEGEKKTEAAANGGSGGDGKGSEKPPTPPRIPPTPPTPTGGGAPSA